MANYTYEQFQKEAQASGLMDQFDKYDLDLAQRYPEFGLSILNLKRNYNSAQTPEQKRIANEMANELRRSYGNYTGGSDGSQYISTGRLDNKIDDILGRLEGYGSFSYGSAPSYSNPYADKQEELLDAILNRPDFSWSKETDPLWGSLKKTYLREGERATANALGQAAAMSGGRPSSYAATAATQAGDYYATQLNDKIPELYRQAYDRYLDDYNMMLSDLNQVNTQQQLDYQEFLNNLAQYNTDRNFAYGQYTDDFNRLASVLGAYQGQADREYNQYLDRLAQNAATQELNRAQIDAILAAGGYPSDPLLGNSGYWPEYVDAMRGYYGAAAGGSGAGSSAGTGGGGKPGSLSAEGQGILDEYNRMKSMISPGSPTHMYNGSNMYSYFGRKISDALARGMDEAEAEYLMNMIGWTG